MPRRTGFTIVELLVVTAIVAVMAAILLPALRKAREAAVRVRCAAQLQQWGVGLANYASDNKGDIPCTWGPIYSGVYPYTYRVHSPANLDANISTAPAILSLEMMGKYLKGVPADVYNAPASLRKTDGVWRCPSAWGDRELLEAVNLSQWDSPGWIYGEYLYFAHTEMWTPANGYRADIMSNPEDLLRNKPDAGRIWMSDACFRWSNSTPPGAWYYNHRIGGRANVIHYGTGAVVTGKPQISGMNQLFGDGHVSWRPQQEFNPAAMDALTPGPGCRMVRGGSNDATFY